MLPLPVIALSFALVFSATESHAQDPRYMRHDFVGCATKSLYLDAFDMMRQSDWVAVAGLIGSGRCRQLDQGATVYRTGASITGLVRVRVRGETSEWWTGAEQITN